MGKKKKRTRKRNQDNVFKLPHRDQQDKQQNQEQKLSVIIDDMDMWLLKKYDITPSLPVIQALMTLASAAWNSAVGDNILRDHHLETLDRIDWSDENPCAELRSNNTDRLISELVEYKREHYPNDFRRIIATEMSSEGKFRVHWVKPEKVVNARFGAAISKKQNVRAKRGQPIAERLVKKMKKYASGKVIDLDAFKAGRADAEELQKTVAARDKLAEYHPAHAAYVYTQNQVSVMSEQLMALDEMSRFMKIFSKAEDLYLPSGPPMSPLTASFFTCWVFFDAKVGLAEETIGTTTMAVGAAFGMSDEMVRIIGLMQESRMGIYVHEGIEGDSVILRELVTDRVCRAIVPSGYRGQKGELWYARVLPPPLPGNADHVVFTTPYVLLQPEQHEWQAYFRRTLPDAPIQERIDSYEYHMKFGPTRDYWTEFVFEAYVNYQTEVIFLAGLPDIPESRPHSRVNSQMSVRHQTDSFFDGLLDGRGKL